MRDDGAADTKLSLVIFKTAVRMTTLNPLHH